MRWCVCYGTHKHGQGSDDDDDDDANHTPRVKMPARIDSDANQDGQIRSTRLVSIPAARRRRCTGEPGMPTSYRQRPPPTATTTTTARPLSPAAVMMMMTITHRPPDRIAGLRAGLRKPGFGSLALEAWLWKPGFVAFQSPPPAGGDAPARSRPPRPPDLEPPISTDLTGHAEKQRFGSALG